MGVLTVNKWKKSLLIKVIECICCGVKMKEYLNIMQFLNVSSVSQTFSRLRQTAKVQREKYLDSLRSTNIEMV